MTWKLNGSLTMESGDESTYFLGGSVWIFPPFPNSLKLQKVPVEEFSQTFDYGLKDITNLDDFNQVVDWENSSFYQKNLKEKN